MLRVAALIAVAVVTSGCSGEDDAAPSQQPYLVHGEAGVRIELPEDWHSLNPDDGNITDPRTRIAIASGPLRASGHACDTQVTHFAPDVHNVAVVVFEWESVDGVPPPVRPPRFDSKALPVREGALECFDGDGGSVQFTERGRIFGLYLLVGRDASEELVAEVRAALGSLRVDASNY